MKERTYVTFGQVHKHEIDGTVLDKDCVAVLTTEEGQGRTRAFELFKDKFCFEYNEENWNPKQREYFPRGYIEVDKDDKAHKVVMCDVCGNLRGCVNLQRIKDKTKLLTVCGLCAKHAEINGYEIKE